VKFQTGGKGKKEVDSGGLHLSVFEAGGERGENWGESYEIYGGGGGGGVARELHPGAGCCVAGRGSGMGFCYTEGKREKGRGLGIGEREMIEGGS